MLTSERIALIRSRLTEALHPSTLEIIDDSEKHRGHHQAQGGGHFTVRLATEAFQNKKRLECHRLVYAALGDALNSEIHALRIIIED